jgi:hypothetical protein
MKMPSGLIIQDRKLTSYLLIYQPNDDKSEFLARAGYTLQTWQLLTQDILKAVEGMEVTEITETEWGKRFRVNTQWAGLNGRLLKVMTIWQQDNDSKTIRFVTLYPDKTKTLDSMEED